MILEIDLRAIRKQRGLSVDEASKQVSVTRQTWYRWEKGQLPGNDAVMKALVKWLIALPKTLDLPKQSSKPKILLKDLFEVYLEPIAGVSPKEMASYIQDAVISNCGSLHPKDPLFHLERKSVSVKLVKV